MAPALLTSLNTNHWWSKGKSIEYHCLSIKIYAFHVDVPFEFWELVLESPVLTTFQNNGVCKEYGISIFFTHLRCAKQTTVFLVPPKRQMHNACLTSTDWRLLVIKPLINPYCYYYRLSWSLSGWWFQHFPFKLLPLSSKQNIHGHCSKNRGLAAIWGWFHKF